MKSVNDKLDGSKLKENPGPMPSGKPGLILRREGPEYKIYLDLADGVPTPRRLTTITHGSRDVLDVCVGLIRGLAPKCGPLELRLELDFEAQDEDVQRGLRKARSIVL